MIAPMEEAWTEDRQPRVPIMDSPPRSGTTGSSMAESRMLLGQDPERDCPCNAVDYGFHCRLSPMPCRHEGYEVFGDMFGRAPHRKAH
jgi:hypothetical protein